ncbi:DNA recombination protein RmuC [Acidipila rosea]|uniref:DNA recombination protein RmuC n=1 Tax=Acidipila rosea TaxID=768535 RepID=A0A4R1L9P7_9BACT|nr:DNA recombination protein RmuC [Acidipila rosea]TCK75088.1 DNA recombination protein RmuC [Acidipila rosea]
MLSILVVAIFALAAGLALGFLLTRGRAAEAARELDSLRARESAAAAQLAASQASAQAEQRRAAEIQAALDQAAARQMQLQGEVTALSGQLAEATAKLAGEREKSAEKLALLADAREQLSNQFKALASDILEEKSKRFTEQNQANLGALLTPLKEKFGEFQQKVESLEKDSITGRSELRVQIDQLKTLNQQLSQDASNLVSALKGSSKTQGDWGEFILEQLLEKAGLRKDHEYTVQETVTREDRSRARLDVLLRLPGNRHIIIDSKVSLNAYSDCCSADEESLRETALTRHIQSMRGHIRELSQRNYQTLYNLPSLDFVVMFVPIEPAFMLAIARDGALWQEAWDKSVLLVSPSTLLFVVRTVAQLWRQEQQTRNVQDIVKRGGELYDKLAAFAKDLIEVGRDLDSAKQSYDDAIKKLSTGRGNAIRQAEMLRSLGVKPTKPLPTELLTSAEEESEPLSIAASAAEQDNF